MGQGIKCWICNGAVALFIGLAGFALGLFFFDVTGLSLLSALLSKVGWWSEAGSILLSILTGIVAGIMAARIQFIADTCRFTQREILDCINRADLRLVQRTVSRAGINQVDTFGKIQVEHDLGELLKPLYEALNGAESTYGVQLNDKKRKNTAYSIRRQLEITERQDIAQLHTALQRAREETGDLAVGYKEAVISGFCRWL